MRLTDKSRYNIVTALAQVCRRNTLQTAGDIVVLAERRGIDLDDYLLALSIHPKVAGILMRREMRRNLSLSKE